MAGAAVAWGLVVAAALLGAAAVAVMGDDQARRSWGKLLGFAIFVLLMLTLLEISRT